MPLQQRRNLCFLISFFELHVFAEPFLPRFCKDAQSPWVGSLGAGAQHSPPHGLNAAAGRLVHSRNLRSTIGTGSTRLAARPETMMTQRQSARLALWLDAEEASR